jgi:hypothetical protein
MLVDDNYEDYRDFNDMDYGTALSILNGTPQDQGNFYPKPQQPAQMQQPIIPNMDYNSALALLKPASGKENVPRGTSQENPQFGGKFGDVLMHGLAGTATSGRNLLNTLQKGGESTGLNKIMGNIPGVKNITRGENDKNFDFYKALGVNENLADKLGVGLLDYAPYGVGASKALAAAGKELPAVGKFLANNPKTAMLAENMLGGGAYDGLGGAIAGGVGGALGAGLGGLTQLAAKKYAQSAIPEFISKSTDELKKILPENMTKGLAGKFIMSNVKNAKNWQNVESQAQNLSNEMTQSGKQFNAEPYHGFIDTYLQKIGKLSPAQRAPYKNAIEFAQQAKELSPTNFTDLVSLRQNMNNYLKGFENKVGITKSDRYSKQFVRDLKDKLSTDLIEKNSGNVSADALKGFKNTWESANKSHQDVNQYYKSLNPAGVVKPMRSTREAYEAIKGGAPMDMAVVGKYMPKPQQTGIEGFKKLEKLYGSKEAAQNAAKAFLFRRPSEQGANTVDVAAIYSKLSPVQRKYIFGNSKEGKMLESVNKTRLEFGREPARDFWKKGGHGILSYGLPFAIGAGGASAAGRPWDEALGVGAGLSALSKGTGALAGKTATPYLANAATNLAKRPIAAPGRYINALMQKRGESK